MSSILSRYQESDKLRVKEARDIPGKEVNYIDIPNTYQNQFKTFQELRKTTYTDLSLNYYDDMRLRIVIPPSFRPAEEGINLNRWGPNDGYYNPGSRS